VDPRDEALAGRRLRLFARVCLVWGFILVLRLIDLQVINHSKYLKYAQSQQVRKVEVKASRGTIYDRTGEVLAMSVEAESVVVNPTRIPDVSVAADLLAHQLELDPKPLLAKLEQAKARRNGFLYVKRRISDEEAERLRSYNLGWIEFRKESIRVYPREERAAHVLGSVDFDEQGNNGVERSLNKYLRGIPGEMRTEADVKKVVFNRNVFSDPQPGRNVTLTIDERIQFVAERALKQAVQVNKCTTGSIVVMNPKTGEILAMTSYPTFNPNERMEPGDDLKPRLNLATSAPFEPGSVFKVITVAAALETTNITPKTMISCGNGRITLFKRVIRDIHAYPALTVEDVLAKSSNIGAINIGLRVGNQRLWEYVRKFGFGSKTGIAMPAEDSGWLRHWQKWHPAAIGSIAMGHEIITTTVQLARAASVVANGGMLVKPRVVLNATKITPSSPGQPQREETEQIEKQEQPIRIIKPETAITMRRMMEHVVLAGTGTKAKLDGYTSGGKTGSAQIYDPVARVYTHKYNASFMGFAPVNNPALVVVVTLNGASKYGGAVAAPVFAEVAGAALRFLDVPRDLPDTPITETPAKEEPPIDDLALAELSVPIAPEELIDAPLVGPELPPEMIPTGPKVPNFRGKTKRQVMEESSALGVSVQIAGTGIARRQEPRPGSVLRPGERVRVQFAR
jgi:cell division protein FtsI (penicillin-binding protein 3)